MKDDLISRQAAIEAIRTYLTDNQVEDADWHANGIEYEIKGLPSAQPEPHYDEWCETCKEYDQERHGCPRWNRVIRQTVDDLKIAQPTKKVEEREVE